MEHAKYLFRGSGDVFECPNPFGEVIARLPQGVLVGFVLLQFDYLFL